MKVWQRVLIVLVAVVVGTTGSAEDSRLLQAPYLGQNPPGSIPEVFAPGIVSGPYDERMLVFANDGTRLLYQLRGVPVSVIVEMEAVDGGWSSPQVASFSGRYFAEFGVTPDGRSVILTSNRPLAGLGPPDEVFHTYRVDQSDDGSWREPEYLGENLDGIGHPSIAASGNLYFFRYNQPDSHLGAADLFMSVHGDDGYGPPINLGAVVNSKHYDVDPYVAPDESYLVFASNREPAGLYVTFRRQDWGWTDPRHMGDELAAGNPICPWVSPDGHYLFFTSNRTLAPEVPEQPLSYSDKLIALGGPGNGSNDIYWVDASIIDKLKQEVLPDRVQVGWVPAAEIFAPEVVSTSGDEAILTVVSGDVCYLTRSEPGFDGAWTEVPVFRSERRGNEWSEPVRVGSPGEPWYLGYREAEVGERVTFAWALEPDGLGATSGIDIWSVEMTSAGWSEPKPLPPPINLDGVDSWPVTADSGALYFFSDRPGGLGEGDLYRVVDTLADQPIVEHLGDGINSPAMEHDPCVAPDESFLVFASNRPGGFGGNDLYVSFPNSMGGWSEPINLGLGVNSELEDARPVLSSDEETLYFTRESATGMDVYRVPASVVTAARLRDLSGPT